LKKKTKNNNSLTRPEIINKAFELRKIQKIEEDEVMYKYFGNKWKDINIKEPSTFWLENLLKKKDFKAKTPSILENDRFSKCTTSNVSKWFKEIEDQLKEENIDINTYNPNLIFNMDETMITADKTLQVYTKKVKAVTKSLSISKEHVTLLATINAAGNYFEPTAIFPLKTLPKVLESMVKDGDLIVAGQDCGCINKSTFDSWCKWFVSKTNSIRNKLKLEENAILILDGHNSRENPDAIKYLKENKVTLVILPSNSTHVLQPLDVSIFSPFKNYLTKSLTSPLMGEGFFMISESFFSAQVIIYCMSNLMGYELFVEG